MFLVLMSHSLFFLHFAISWPESSVEQGLLVILNLLSHVETRSLAYSEKCTILIRHHFEAVPKIHNEAPIWIVGIVM